jgi:hypothetical protein
MRTRIKIWFSCSRGVGGHLPLAAVAAALASWRKTAAAAVAAAAGSSFRWGTMGPIEAGTADTGAASVVHIVRNSLAAAAAADRLRSMHFVGELALAQRTHNPLDVAAVAVVVVVAVAVADAETEGSRHARLFAPWAFAAEAQGASAARQPCLLSKQQHKGDVKISPCQVWFAHPYSIFGAEMSGRIVTVIPLSTALTDPSKSGLMNKHIVKHIVSWNVCGSLGAHFLY